MKKALIGYTGFVGSNLMKQVAFDYTYNSKNISDISGKSFDLLVCAGVSAVKWKANKFPEEDLNSINTLLEELSEVKAEKVVLISTVDVYKNPIVDVNEDTKINPDELEPYGKHRNYVEQFIKEKFNKNLIVRLPGLFGEGLKKNFIYDMINNNCLELTDEDSIFQFYYLKNLWKDIEKALDNNISLINFASEPVKIKDIALQCFNVEFKNKTEKPPVFYDMKSKYYNVYGGKDGYLYNKEEVYNQLKDYLSMIEEN